MTSTKMEGALYGVNRIGKRIDFELILSGGDRARVLRLLKKGDWSHLRVTVEVKED